MNDEEDKCWICRRTADEVCDFLKKIAKVEVITDDLASVLVAYPQRVFEKDEAFKSETICMCGICRTLIGGWCEAEFEDKFEDLKWWEEDSTFRIERI